MRDASTAFRLSSARKKKSPQECGEGQLSGASKLACGFSLSCPSTVDGAEAWVLAVRPYDSSTLGEPGDSVVARVATKAQTRGMQ